MNDDVEPEVAFAKVLLQNKWMVATAESCTGGRIGALLTKHSGSSSFYKGSVIAYCNEVKSSVLGVKQETLETEGAVCASVVEQMAKGVVRLLKSDLAIAVSGVAGPGGGSEEKPVGTVWIAVSGKEKCVAKKFLFNTTRENFIERTSNQAILMCLEVLASKYQD
jgi:nicotinamide-nucleotide amidase